MISQECVGLMYGLVFTKNQLSHYQYLMTLFGEMFWQFQVKVACGASVLIFFIVTNVTLIIFVDNYSFFFASWTILQYIKISFHDHFKNLICFHGCSLHVVFKIKHLQICFMFIAFYIDEMMALKFAQLGYFAFFDFLTTSKHDIHDYIHTNT